MQISENIKIETHCKGCVFAQRKMSLEGNLCQLGRLEKFPKGKVVDGYYKFNRFCNAYRPQKWLDDLDTALHPIQVVNQEIHIKMGFTINFTNNHDLHKLKHTLDSVFWGDDGPYYVIVVNDKPEYNGEIHQLISKKNIYNSRIHIVQILDQVPEYYMDEAFKFARNGYMIYLYSGDIMPYNYVEKLNSHINHDLKFLSICFSGDGRIIFQNSLFKLLGGNKSLMKQDGTMDNRDFIAKAMDMKANEKCIYLWEEIFGYEEVPF